MKIDFGRLTDEETVDLLRGCIDSLPETLVIETLCDVLKGDFRAELIASLEATEMAESQQNNEAKHE
jgi:hypothetical protein